MELMIVCNHGVEHKTSLTYHEVVGDTVVEAFTQTYCMACIFEELLASMVREGGQSSDGGARQ